MDDMLHFRCAVREGALLTLAWAGQASACAPITATCRGLRGLNCNLPACLILPCTSSLSIPRSVMPQDHFNYAATWWTLSAATLALAVKAIRQGVKAR